MTNTTGLRYRTEARDKGRKPYRLDYIVRRATQMLDRSGYANVSMEDLRDSVGLAKPTLYHYVKSKHEILHLIHQGFMSIGVNKLAKRIDGREPEAELQGFIVDLVEIIGQYRPAVGVFFAHFRELPAPKRNHIVAQRREYVASVERLVRRGIRRGAFRSDADPTLVTLAIFGACNSAFRWYEPDGHLPAREIGKAFANVVLSGLRVNHRRGRRTETVPWRRRPFAVRRSTKGSRGPNSSSIS